MMPARVAFEVIFVFATNVRCQVDKAGFLINHHLKFESEISYYSLVFTVYI